MKQYAQIGFVVLMLAVANAVRVKPTGFEDGLGGEYAGIAKMISAIAKFRENGLVQKTSTTSRIIPGEGFSQLNNCVMHLKGSLMREDLNEVFDAIANTYAFENFNSRTNDAVKTLLYTIHKDIFEHPLEDHVYNLSYQNEEGAMNLFFINADASKKTPGGILYNIYLLDTKFKAANPYVILASSSATLIDSESKEEIKFLPGVLTEAHLNMLFDTHMHMGLFMNNELKKINVEQEPQPETAHA